MDEFCNEDNGLWIRLEPEPLPITVNLLDPAYLHRVYELIPRIGWHLKFAPAGRNWRELREVHECRETSARRGRDKKENERKREPQ